MRRNGIIICAGAEIWYCPTFWHNFRRKNTMRIFNIEYFGYLEFAPLDRCEPLAKWGIYFPRPVPPFAASFLRRFETSQAR